MSLIAFIIGYLFGVLSGVSLGIHIYRRAQLKMLEKDMRQKHWDSVVGGFFR